LGPKSHWPENFTTFIPPTHRFHNIAFNLRQMFPLIQLSQKLTTIFFSNKDWFFKQKKRKRNIFFVKNGAKCLQKTKLLSDKTTNESFFKFFSKKIPSASQISVFFLNIWSEKLVPPLLKQKNDSI
jgi:hypothetical protein